MQDNAMRRAAILISSLDVTTADALLENLPADVADAIRHATVDLHEVDPYEIQQARAEFLAAGGIAGLGSPSADGDDHPGVELTLSDDVREALDDDAPEPNRPTVARCDVAPSTRDACAMGASSAAPFAFLCDADCDRLTELLSRERPRTVAVVLSHLEESRAVSVLARLHASLQFEVTRAWVDLNAIDETALAEIERDLRQRYTANIQPMPRTASGLSQVARAMRAADPMVSERLLANLAQHDASLARRLAVPRLEFSDLESWDGPRLAELVACARRDELVLALAAAPPRLVERTVRCLPRDEAKDLRRSLAALGPTRLSDVQEAQRRVARLAERLAAGVALHGAPSPRMAEIPKPLSAIA